MEPDYYQIRKDAHEYFMNLKPIYCPALETEIHFCSSGFNHIIYKKGNLERDRSEQIERFQMLPLAMNIIAKTTMIQEQEEISKLMTIKRYKKKFIRTRNVIYYGLIAIIEKRKIKVILRKIGNGNVKFWSIIPYYSTSPRRDGMYMKGNPEHD